MKTLLQSSDIIKSRREAPNLKHMLTKPDLQCGRKSHSLKNVATEVWYMWSFKSLNEMTLIKNYDKVTSGIFKSCHFFQYAIKRE